MNKFHNTMLEQRLQANLRRIRLAMGLTQKEVAVGAGIGGKSNGSGGVYVAQIESGSRGIGPIAVEKIAGFFGVDPAVLYAPTPETADAPAKPASGVLPAPIGPYSLSRSAGGFVFLSGQLPVDPKTGKMVRGGIREQTKCAAQNLESVLAADGLSLRNIVRTTVYLADLSVFQEMNAAYGAFFAPPFPARTTIPVPELPLGALVEIDGIACIG